MAIDTSEVLWLIPLLVCEVLALTYAFTKDADADAPPPTAPPLADYDELAPPSPPASPPGSPAQARRLPVEPRRGPPHPRPELAWDSYRFETPKPPPQSDAALHAAPTANGAGDPDQAGPAGCLGGRRVHMLCPLPPRFRRTWWVKSVFSSLVAQELTVAAYLAVHTEVPLNRFPTVEVFVAAIISGGVALVVQAICAVTFQQAGRYTDILGAREVERRYGIDPLYGVDWEASQHSESSIDSRGVERRAGQPAVRRAPAATAPPPVRENPFMGNRATYGYGAAYDARQRCGIATPAGLAVASRGRGLSPPPSPPGSCADGEERQLLPRFIEEYNREAPVSGPDPGPPAVPRAVMTLCWAAQLAFALALLLAASWISATHRSWRTHRVALMASLFIGFGLRILVFEPLLVHIIPRCFAGRVFSENAFGTHRWEYRPPVGGPPEPAKPAPKAAHAASSATSSARQSIGPSVSQRPSRAMSDEAEERLLLTTNTVISI